MSNRGKAGRKAVVWDWQFLSEIEETEQCYRLNARQVNALLTPMAVMAWQTRWQNKPQNFSDVLQFMAEITHALLVPVNCDNSVTSTNAGNDESTSARYDKFLELFMELDVKFSLNGELYEAAIPLVPCGCTDGQAAGNSEGVGVPVAGSIPGGIDYSNITTLCDFITTIVPFIRNQVDAFLDTIGNGSFFVSLGKDYTAWGSVAEQLLESIEDVEMELDDPNFMAFMQRAALRSSFPDPITEIDRNQLRAFARKIPNNYDAAPMGLAFMLWAEFANVEAINIQIPKASGTGNASNCDLLFAEVGRQQFNPVDAAPTGAIEVIETSYSNYKVYRIPFNRDTDSSFQEEFPVPTGEIFRGYIWDNVYVTADTTGGASASIMRKTPSNQEWQFFLSDRNQNPNRWAVYVNPFVAVQDIEQSLFLTYGAGKTRVPKSENAVSLDTDNVDALSVANNAKFLNIGAPNEMFIGTLYIISEIKNP